MKIEQFDQRVATIEFTWDEIGIVNNALNEVSNGLHLEGEFDTRMGRSVDEAQELLALINHLGVTM